MSYLSEAFLVIILHWGSLPMNLIIASFTSWSLVKIFWLLCGHGTSFTRYQIQGQTILPSYISDPKLSSYRMVDHPIRCWTIQPFFLPIRSFHQIIQSDIGRSDTKFSVIPMVILPIRSSLNRLKLVYPIRSLIIWFKFCPANIQSKINSIIYGSSA